VVDNTTVLTREREKCIRMAKAAGYAIIGYYFQSRLGDAMQRNQLREGKAVIPEKGVMAKSHSMQRPSYGEGFDRLYYVSIGKGGSFNVEEWVEI
jgi:predicted kinase